MKPIIKHVIIIFLGLVSCKNISDKNSGLNVNTEFNKLGLDDKSTLLIDSEYNSWLKNRYGFEKWEPKANDIQIVHNLIDKAVKNDEFYFLEKPIKENLEKYYRQYIPYIDNNGDHIIEVSAFCEIPEFPPEAESKSGEWIKMDWKSEFVRVEDGGKCYWQIKINLDKKKYFNLGINSIA